MYPMGPSLFSRFKEIENFSRIQHLGEVFVATERNRAYTYGIYADTAFFKIFGMPIIEYDYTKKPLASKNEIVITRRAAQLLFETEDVVGMECTISGNNFYVVGLMDNPPKNSHLQFALLVSHVTIEKNTDRIDWTKNSYVTYLLLEDISNARFIANKLEEFERANLEDPSLYSLYLQSLSKVHYTSEDLVHDAINFNKTGRIIVITCLVVLIFLYVMLILFLKNLSEKIRNLWYFYGIGIVIGYLIAQGAAFLIKANILDIFYSALNMRLRIVIIILVIFPILLFHVLDYILKFAAKHSRYWINQSGNIIKSQVVMYLGIPFASMLILMIYFSVSRQYHAFKSIPGNHLQNIIEVPLTRSSGEVLKPIMFALRNDISIIEVASAVSMPMGRIHQRGIDYEGKTSEVPIVASVMYIDANFLDFFEIQINEGRNFSATSFLDKQNAFIINESLAHLTGWKEGERIGRSIGLQSAASGTLIGVVEDFNFFSRHFQSGPLLLQFSDEPEMLLLKYVHGHRESTIEKISAEWEKWNKEPIRVIDYTKRFKDKYAADLFLTKLVLFILVSICGFCILYYHLIKSSIEFRPNKIYSLLAIAFAIFTPIILIRSNVLFQGVTEFSFLIDIVVVILVAGGVWVVLNILSKKNGTPTHN